MNIGAIPARRAHAALFIVVMLVSLISAMLLGDIRQANYFFYDFFLRLRPASATDFVSPTVIVAIDDPTVRAQGSVANALDREKMARALQVVCAAKPAVVGLDVVYSERDVASPKANADLAAAMKRCGNVVLSAFIAERGEWFEPIPEFAGAAATVGHVHSQPGDDGVVREILLQKPSAHQRYWALALECFRRMQGDTRPVLETEDGLETGGITIPAPSWKTGRPLYINYGPPIPHVSMQSVLDGKTTPADFAGKAILIGVTTSDETDRKMTPVSFGVSMPGVEIHAHLLNTLLRRAFLVPWRDSTAFLAQLAIAATVGVALYWLHGVVLGAAVVGLMIAVHALPFWFLLHGEVAPAFPMAASFWLPLFGGGGFQYWTTWRHFLAADASQRRLRRQVEFVTHEMRSPLAAIQGSGELIGRYNLDEKRRKQISDMIGRESQRIARMFERFLDVERLSAGEIALRRDPVDLRTVVEIAAERVKPSADRKHIEMQVTLDNPGNTEGDAELLEFAVYNLMSNAVKYSPEGSVVRVRAAAQAGKALIEVRDQGAGISKEDAARIFERFYRTADAEASGKPGLGLGLSIVREIVRHHGGVINLESQLGVGSAFAVTLPSKN